MATLFSQGLHVLGKEKGALQNLGHMIDMASLEFPDGGIPGQCCAIELQLGILGQMVYISQVLGLPALHRSLPLSIFFHFFIVLGPSIGQSPPPRSLSPSSSSFASLDRGAGREGKGKIGRKLGLWGLLE